MGMIVTPIFYDVAIAWLSIFTIPGCIFYAIVIIALLFNRRTVPFDSSFFALWINTGVADILMTAETWTFVHAGTLNNIWPVTLQNVHMHHI
jgi:hypothetical protein